MQNKKEIKKVEPKIKYNNETNKKPLTKTRKRGENISSRLTKGNYQK